MKFPPLYFVAPFILQSTVWRILMRPFFNYFVHFEVKGLENLKGFTGPIIFAPNHSNEIDSVLIPLALPLWSRFSPMFYVVRESKFYTDPYFSWRKYIYGGWIFKALGAYPVRSGMKDYAVSLANHVQILKDGGSVCIFPEGGFTKTGEIGAAHGGVGYLASTTNRPVVPILVRGTFDFTTGAMIRGKTKIKIAFLPPVDHPQSYLSQNPTIDDFRTFGERVLDSLRSERMRALLSS